MAPYTIAKVKGKPMPFLNALWQARELGGPAADLKIVSDEGIMSVHRLVIALASPILSEEMANARFIDMPHMTLTELRYFLKIVYGRSFKISYTRLPRLRALLARYRVSMPSFELEEMENIAHYALP